MQLQVNPWHVAGARIQCAHHAQMAKLERLHRDVGGCRVTVQPADDQASARPRFIVELEIAVPAQRV